MIRSLILLLTVAACLIACQKNGDDTPTPALPLPLQPFPLFTLIIDPSFKTDTGNNWVIVNDATSGEPVAFKPFESGQTIKLETASDLPATTVTITILSYTPGPIGKGYYGKTYFGIPKAETWTLKTPAYETNTTPGSSFDYYVSITTDKKPKEITLSDNWGATLKDSYGISGGFALKGAVNPGAPNQHLSLRLGWDVLKHKFIRDIKNTTTYTFQYEELDDFDQVVNFSFPSTNNFYLGVSGREPGSAGVGYTTCSLRSYQTSPDYFQTLNAGYLNALTNYKTELDLWYSSYQYEYANTGAIPGAISWPDPSKFKVDNTTITNFSIGTAPDYQYRVSTWGSNASQPLIGWQFMSNSSSYLFKGLPADLKALVPDVDLNALTYNGTKFYTKGLTFDETWRVEFKGSALPDTVETIAVILY